VVVRVTQRAGAKWCAAAAVLFGAATPLLKLLTEDLGAFSLSGLLYLGAAAAVAPSAARGAGRRVRALGGRDARLLATSVVLGGMLAPLMLMVALDRVAAGTVSLLLTLELVATAAVARVVLREHVGGRTAAGIGLVVAANVALVAGDSVSWDVGALLVVGTCLCWATDNVATAGIGALRPAQITLVKGLVAGSVNLAIGLAVDGPPSGDALGVLVVGALSYGLSIPAWITGARLLGAARGQVIFALAPFVGLALSVPINGEAIAGVTALAAGGALLGVLVMSTGGHEHEHVHEAIEHRHAIDGRDPHHAPERIEILDGDLHRHVAFAHAHAHVPDAHHRHDH